MSGQLLLPIADRYIMRAPTTLILASALSLLVTSTGCTDADLLRIEPGRPFLDNKLSVLGDLCTTPPESRVFPLRVLFIIDSSEGLRCSGVQRPPQVMVQIRS